MHLLQVGALAAYIVILILISIETRKLLADDHGSERPTTQDRRRACLHFQILIY